MKVIKKGRDQRGWSGNFECTGRGNGGGGCGAVLLVEQSDLFKTSRGDYVNPVTSICVTFQCSECDIMTDIYEDGHGRHGDFPDHILRTLPTRRPSSPHRHARD